MRLGESLARSVAPPTLDSEAYWCGIDDGVLRLQKCTRCEKSIFRPRPLCPHCSSTELAWVPVSGNGRVWSFSVVHRAVSKAFSGVVPYVVALVELDEGPIMMTNIVDVDLSTLSIGQRVGVGFGDAGDGRSVPLFRPLDPHHAATGQGSSREQ